MAPTSEEGLEREEEFTHWHNKELLWLLNCPVFNEPWSKTVNSKHQFRNTVTNMPMPSLTCFLCWPMD